MHEEQMLPMIEKLKVTARCRPEIKETSKCFRELDPEDHAALIRHLIGGGEGQALGILLNVCAVNNVKLAPDLLSQTLAVVKPINDFAALYRDQDQNAIQSLLVMAESQDISGGRSYFAARIAAELTIQFHQDPGPVKKVLTKLLSLPLPNEVRKFNILTLALLEQEDIRNSTRWFTRAPLLEFVPERKPPVVIGGAYSVRRPIPKLGRNEPCHCGSGKKYKKCCIEKDQALIRDASPHEGVTMSELKSNPGRVDSPDIINKISLNDLKKLNPKDLTSPQLFEAYLTAFKFEIYDLALTMLLKLKDRPDYDLDHRYFNILLVSALRARNLELARRIRVHIPDDQLFDLEDTELHFTILENPTWLDRLESRCRRALTGEHEEWQAPLASTAHIFETCYPGLSIVFNRAAIVQAKEKLEDPKQMMCSIQNSRIELDLDPWADPIDGFIDWVAGEIKEKVRNVDQAQEIEHLKEKVTEAKQLATQKQVELREKEQELAALNRRLLKTPLPQQQGITHPQTSESDRQIISRLRQRIDGLKQDISDGQQERRGLRQQIQQAMANAESEQEAESGKQDNSDTSTPPIPFEDAPQTILFPEFTTDFHNSSKNIDRAIVIKALKAATGFAVHDRLIWRQTKALTTLQSIYRIRVGINHRLLIRWEKNIRLQILDLIHRQQLETWIKGFRRKACHQ